MKFYVNIKTVIKPSDYLVLVNKNNKLNNNYIPDDLVKINNNYTEGDKYLRREVYKNITHLIDDANNLGLTLSISSAFRSYLYQNNLYNYYVKSKGIDYADLCSARLGHSEHQTGLAVDLEGSNKDYDNFVNSKEFNWVSKNAHKYGFILRYNNNKVNITGFKYEPWHYRYVGKDAATYIYNNNICLEEYIKKMNNHLS